MKKAFALVAVAGLVASHSALAGTIRYRLQNGSTILESGDISVIDVEPYTDVPINVGDVGLSGATLHVYDINGTSANIGKIIIQGRIIEAGGSVRVVVAYEELTSTSGPGFEAAFTNPVDPVDPGLRNLGGIDFVPPTLFPTDTSLRDNAAVSVNVVGDITGDVVAGTLFRIDARRDLVAGFGGEITGDLRATRGDAQISGANSPAIGFVRAGWKVEGDIVAQGEPSGFNLYDAATWGSIGSVIVGPSESATGLTGSILAENGAIDEIRSSGPIGTSNTIRSQIKAGLRIGRIATRASGTDFDSLLEKNVYADVDASVQQTASTLFLRQSSISVIETKGDFIGSISVHDVDGGTDPFGPTFGNGRKGIFVGGQFIGDIHVEENYLRADMIARSFQGTITVGKLFSGAIVAVAEEGSSDPLNGTIGSIVLGTGEGTGFASSNGQIVGPCFEGACRDIWYNFPISTGTSIDDVIRADKSIGSIEIRTIANRLLGNFNKPRIEAQQIGVLRIEHFDSGVVWSGNLGILDEDDVNDIADDYASIGVVEIGCMGPKADLWVEDCPLVDVAGDCYGEIHMPTLASGETVRIGGRFGDLAQVHASVPALCVLEDTTAIGIYKYLVSPVNNISLVVTEGSPRLPWPEIEDNDQSPGYGLATYGGILIRSESGLHGQVILHANNTIGTHVLEPNWRGSVEVFTDPLTANTRVFSIFDQLVTTPPPYDYDEPIATTDSLGPTYAALPTEFGGGAVGLVPFALHNRASWPPNPGPGEQPPQVLLEPVINDPDEPLPGERRTIDLEFYGPVRATGTDHPVLIYKAPLTDPTAFASQPVNAMFQIAVRRTGMGGDSSRLLVISRSPGQMIPKGVYKVVPIRDTSAASFLYCDGLESPTPVADFVYLFAVGGDCNSNGTADAYDIANGTSLDLNPVDTIPDECDPPVSGTCAWRFETGNTPSCEAADYDNNGGVDGSDLAAFFVDFEAGETCADVDQNGGVDGADIGAFFAFFEAGGC